MMIIPATYRFSAHCSKQFVCFIIIHKIQSHNCDTGWSLYHISMVFISIPFKHKKARLVSNFQLFPPRGLPHGNDRISTLFYVNNQ